MILRISLAPYLKRALPPVGGRWRGASLISYLLPLTLVSLLPYSALAQEVRPVEVVFIGNSITQGARLAHPETEGPAQQACDALRARGHEVSILNRGLSGTTTCDWLPNDTTRCYAPLIEACDAYFTAGAQHIFSIMLGTNDSAETRCNGAPVSAERYEANLCAIIDSLLARYADAQVVVNYPIWYSPTTYNGAKYLQTGLDRLQTYHPIIAALPTRYGGRVVAGVATAFDTFRGRPELFDEEEGQVGKFYLHPNAEGARLLGRIWAEGIEMMLKD